MPINTQANLAEIREYTTWLLEQDRATEEDFWTPAMLNAFIAAEHDFLVSEMLAVDEGWFSAAVLTDIIANEPFYPWPDDHRMTRYLERAVAGVTDSWVSIDPAPNPGFARSKYAVPGGVGLSGIDQTTLVLRRHRLQGARVLYENHGNGFVLIPYFNVNYTNGMRLWYDYRPPAPVDDTWIPFDGTLKGHRELLALGALRRAKGREELAGAMGRDYDRGINLFRTELEVRQTQASRHVVPRG